MISFESVSVRRCSLIAVLLAELSTTPAHGETCEGRGILVDQDFAGGAYATCVVDENNRVRLTITPENTPINASPWYAFRVKSEQGGMHEIHLDYGEFKHRYPPDISYDGSQWRRLSDDALSIGNGGSEALLAIDLPAGLPVIIAAQPLLVSRDYRLWLDSLEKHDEIEVAQIGTTPGDRPLWRASTLPRGDTLLLLGRQHPPETTGAVAMMAFVERLLADDTLANAFRAEVGLLIYPLINPDGVDDGHWRHNSGGVDLNRDWGPFSQPETASVAQNIDSFLLKNNSHLMTSIDFHSTWYEVFYTQDDRTATIAPELLGDWLLHFNTEMQSIEPAFVLNRKPSHNPDKPTAKSYFFERYGVASSTLEIGDATDQQFIRRYAVIAAEALMTAWLGDQ